MISADEKQLIHVYQRAAHLSDADYRAILRAHSGLDSCANAAFSHRMCDAVLAALETVLFDRVHRGLCPDPRHGRGKIQDEFHFRRRLQDPGRINARQRFRIMENWTALASFLPSECRTVSYLNGIICRATGKASDLSALTGAQAGAVMDALRDRLAYAIRNIAN